jgi:hypothetical protein
MNPDTLAIDVWRSCLAPNGTGDILDSLQLRQRLDFQRVLHEGFIDLEDKSAGAVVDIAKFELLVQQARNFGGLFILDPDDPLPLEPSVQPLMIGSSLDPDDQEGPDGESIIRGLNKFAELIAGPGKFSFQHGTSGGGTLITSTSPSEAEVSDEPITTQNALTYARMKEYVLTQGDIFRCDMLDSRFQVTERTCSFEEFRETVLEYAIQVRDAGVRLGQEASLSKDRIEFDLQLSLDRVLEEVRALREVFACRFLWRRWEDFDFMLCNVALPGMLTGCAAWSIMAAFSGILLALHYKMWRHFLDNKIVGEELERFSKRYGYLENSKK